MEKGFIDFYNNKMEKGFDDNLNYYASRIKAIEEELDLKLKMKLRLLVLYKRVDKLKERLDVLEKKFEKSNDEQD